MASKKTIEIIKSTVPALKEHVESITRVFYKNLFNNHPELKDTFNMVHQKKGTQQIALANAVFQYAVHIDKLEMLGNAVENIAQKHTSLSIPKEAYPIVGTHLLGAIKEILGNAATTEIIDAWAEAYGDLASILITKEEDIYKNREKSAGGFRGMKKFVLVDKKAESSVITSFYLKRKDGSEIPHFIPGQFIALNTEIPNTDHKHTRNYSLSDVPNKRHIRISVKKEIGSPNGIVSNYLHDNLEIGSIIDIGMPSGNFVIKDSKKPLVLISGGVGITPLLSMFKYEAKKDNREILFIQCALNSKTHAFKNEINEVTNEKTKSIVVYSEPTVEDKKLINFDFTGLLTIDIFSALKVSNDSDFYFCGPTKFMANTLLILQKMNIKESQINYEFFGPEEELHLN